MDPEKTYANATEYLLNYALSLAFPGFVAGEAAP